MKRWLVAAASFALAACGGGDAEEAPAADTTAQAQAMPMDTGGMHGGMPMDPAMRMHSSMMMDSVMMTDSAGGMRGGRMMAAAREGDQMFLRMMSDHHEGLVRMAARAMEGGGTQTVKDDARTLHAKQTAERDSMVAMLGAGYGERHQPMPMRLNTMQADSLAAASGPAHDRMFYRMVIDHHRQAIMMTDHLLPRMRKPEVRRMAERMRADQQREIRELQQKTGAA